MAYLDSTGLAALWDKIKVSFCTAQQMIDHRTDDTEKYGTMYNLSQTRYNELKTEVLDLQASITNKTINGQTPIDISSPSSSGGYTVVSTLGGRLVGQGVRTIGLLGIVLLSTGTVSVNGTEVYNNTSLIGIGDAEILNIDVEDGDVITSSGMGYLTVTNYVAG